jgi:hypothetical protein
MGGASYEVNIWDTRPDPSYGTGAIVGLAKVKPMPRAGGKWNVYEITAKGSTFTVTLNGQKTADGAQDTKFASRRIALQHGLGVKDDKGVANDKGVVKFARWRSSRCRRGNSIILNWRSNVGSFTAVIRGAAARCVRWRRSGRSADAVRTAGPDPFHKAGLSGYDSVF